MDPLEKHAKRMAEAEKALSQAKPEPLKEPGSDEVRLGTLRETSATLREKFAGVVQYARTCAKAMLPQLEAELNRLGVAIEDALVEMAKLDVNVFIEYVLGYKQGQCHREWQEAVALVARAPTNDNGRFVYDILSGHHRLLIVAPREHGKSSQLAIGRVLWELGRNPNLKVKIVCSGDDSAVERLFAIKEHIEKNDKLHAVFPNLKPGRRWQGHKIDVQRPMISKDASIEAIGVLSSPTGGRANLIVADDVVDRRNALDQPLLRDKVKTAWKADFVNLLEPNGRVVYIATVWHECLPHGERVLTKRGRVAVESLTLTDELRIGPGVWGLPQAIAARPFTGELVCFKIAGQTRPYRMTGNHRLPTISGVKFASDLLIGDTLTQCLGAPHQVLSLSALQAMEPQDAPLRQEKPTRNCPQRPKRKPRVSRESLLADLQEGLTYLEIAKRRGYNGKSYIYRLIKYYGLPHNSVEQRTTPGWIWKPEFWRLAGYWLAEGCHSSDNERTRLVFGHSEEEVGFAKDAARCVLVALGIEAKVNTRPSLVRDRASSTVVEFSCRLVGRWLRDTFEHWSNDKRLPDCVINLPKHLLRELIYGYWISDGASGRLGTRFGTSAINLAYDLQFMFATRFSIVSSVYETRRNNFVAFEVRMRNLDGLSLGLPVPEPKQIHPCYKLAVVDGRMQFPITKVWREFYSGSVYDLQTSTGYFDLAGITSHNSDLTHELKANPEYKILDYSINEQLDPIWQEHWSRARLAQRKSEIGDLEFDRGFRNIALSGHVTIVREDWIKYVKEIPDSARVVYLGALDPASGQNMGNDYTAFVALAVDVQAKKAYVFLQRQARMTFPEQIDFLKEQAAAKPFHYIAIEEVNYQASIRQWCDAHCPMPLVGIKPTVGKAQRLQRATLYMNNGSVLFLDNMHPEEYSSQARDDIDLVTQLRRFPLAAHDDLLDAFVYAVGMASRLFLDEVEEAANDVGEMDDESKYIGDTRVRVLGSAS